MQLLTVVAAALLAAAATASAAPRAERSMTVDELIKETQAKRQANFLKKRNGQCPPWEPFQCPKGECIPIKYLCDGSRDCSDGYDENDAMCTAAVRPPVEDTANFLKSLLNKHGANFLAKIFGPKAVDNMAPMGGVQQVAIAISENPTAEEFGAVVGMAEDDVATMRETLAAIADDEIEGFEGSEANDFRFFAVKLLETGF